MTRQQHGTPVRRMYERRRKRPSPKQAGTPEPKKAKDNAENPHLKTRASATEIRARVNALREQVKELTVKVDDIVKEYQECWNSSTPDNCTPPSAASSSTAPPVSSPPMVHLPPQYQELDRDKLNQLLEGKSDTITMTLVGGTGWGKSFMINSIALCGTPLFQVENVSLLLPSKTMLGDNENCATLISFRLSYCEDAFRLTLHKILDEDDDDDYDDTVTTDGDGGDEEQVEVVEEEDEHDAGEDDDDGDDDAEYEDVQEHHLLYELKHQNTLSKEIWTFALNEIRKQVDQITGQIERSELRISECKYFEIEAPFPLLKKYNLSIIDIPGLTNSDAEVLKSAYAASEDADIVCLVNGSRGKIEPNEFNLIEEFVDRDVNDIPPIVFVNNVSYWIKVSSSGGEKVALQSTSDSTALNTFLNYIDAHHTNPRVFEHVTNFTRRNAIFDRMRDNSFGFAFHGPVSPDRPFSGFISEEHDPFCTIELCRQLVEERQLLKVKQNHIRTLKAIQVTLSGELLNGISVAFPLIQQSVQEEIDQIGKISSRKTYFAATTEVLSKVESRDVIIGAHINRWRKVLLSFISTERYEEIVDGFLNLHYNRCMSLLRRVLIKAYNLDSDHFFTENGASDVSEVDPDKRHDVDALYLKVAMGLSHDLSGIKTILLSIKCLNYVQRKMGGLVKRCKLKFLQDPNKKLQLKSNTTVGLNQSEVAEIVFDVVSRLHLCKWDKTNIICPPNGLEEWLDRGLFSPIASLRTLQTKFEEQVRLSNLNAERLKSVRQKLTSFEQNSNPKMVSNSIHQLHTNRQFQDIVWSECPQRRELRCRDKFDKTTTSLYKNNTSRTHELAEIRVMNHETRDSQFLIDISIDENRSMFAIQLYNEWMEHLRQVLGIPENTSQPSVTKPIFPIFVPSYRRSKEIGHSPLFDEQQFEGAPVLLYIVVEHSEGNKYHNMLKSKQSASRRIVIVTIPDKSRGIGFSRSMILLLQRVLGRLMILEGFPFDYFWMMDDDMVKVRRFSPNSNSLHMMEPCTLALALLKSQDILEGRVKKELLKFDESTMDELQELWGDVKNRIGSVTYQQFKQLVEFGVESQVRSAYNYYQEHSSSDDKLGEDAFNCWFRDDFIPRCKTRINPYVQLSIVSSKENDSRGYNIMQPKEEPSHYFVSTQRSGCVLNYGPGLEGYNYLTENQMLMNKNGVAEEKQRFRTESAVDRIKRIQAISAKLWESKNKRKTNELTNVGGNVMIHYEPRDMFVGEDRKLTERLELDNKTGFKVFFFDVEWSTQKRGGCHAFQRAITK